ncbi:SDR family oxidoreductase [Pseudomonas sp. GX19020]|uniref:SDR family oxidoreductase n=1 Tax=Pseudomonas sp. GX19020 TaxID=2942277 RepID=UPI00201A1F03|nr:SDR family oxidoreductase [Pseudomonas sp. GX19020]MCL4069071.1 SDR family oxidoreductase [Pseudomonas sp. GX19020]
MQRLAGKRALITAAGQGIGRASAERMAAEGAEVIATDVNEALVADLAGLPGITAKVLNVLEPGAITALVAEIGPVDILFNCAGVVHNGTVLEATEAEWDFAFDLNAKAQFRMIRAVLPGMIAQGNGSIINMSSVAGPKKGPINRAVYSASKAAVVGLTRAVAADYVAQGIRCNSICPGTVDSPSLHERLKATGDYEGALKAFIGRQAMGRLGRADEIAALVCYLASDEAGFTTGTEHVIDGGWTT